jgi:metal-dependent HD superfamily phosphatase/phosphodiesterase
MFSYNKIFKGEREMFTYQELVKDESIKNIYDKVDNLTSKRWTTHGMRHINNVVKLVENVLRELKQPENIIQYGMIAAYLHDVGVMHGKNNHAQNGYLFVKDYLKDKDLPEDIKDMIAEAIKNHSEASENSDLLSIVLVFADKLDISKSRLLEEAYEEDGLKEIQYVNGVKVSISDKLIVNFDCDKRFNKEEFEKYYFCNKVFKAIAQLAKYLNKDYQVNINKKEWKYDI